MSKFLRFFIVSILSVIIFYPINGMPKERICSVNEIKSGMRGSCYTVFSEDRIDSIQVEVLGIMENFFPGRSVIIIRLLGEKAAHTGVAAGMSGSPVYIGGKLAGALAYSFGDFPKDPIAGVTPIEEMLEIMDKEKIRHLEQPKLSAHINHKINQAYWNNEPIFEEQFIKLISTDASSSNTTFRPIKTPIVISNLSENLINKLNAELMGSNFRLIAGGKKMDETDSQEEISLQPGDAVNAVLIHGDYDISAMGTVTYVEGDKILAFGHPMFDSGPVEMPMAKGHVLTTITSLMSSFKFGMAGKIIGTIRQDRSSGIMGKLGTAPKMIPVKVKISSPIGEIKHFNFQLCSDKSTFQVLPVYFWMTLLNTLESFRLANGDYGIQLNGAIELGDGNKIELNDFYAGGDLGFYTGSGQDIPEAAFDVAMALNAILVNDFKIPVVKLIDLNFQLKPGIFSARIERVEVDKKNVNPGDSIRVFVSLKPFHQPKKLIQKTIVVPRNIARQKITLVVGGNKYLRDFGKKLGMKIPVPNSFNQLLNSFKKRKRNDIIYFILTETSKGIIVDGKQFEAAPPSMMLQRTTSGQSQTNTLRIRQIAMFKQKSNFAIYGGKKIDLNIE